MEVQVKTGVILFNNGRWPKKHIERLVKNEGKKEE